MPRSSVAVETYFQLSLLGLVTSGFLAVAGSGYLDAPTTILTAIGLLLRAGLVTGLVRFDLSDRAVTVATIAYIGFYPLDYRYVSADFLTATVHLVFFLAVAKILSARNNRDYIYTAAIALLELLAAALLSIQLNFFLFLGLFLLFAIATLTSAEIRRSIEQSRQVSRIPRRRLSPRLAGLTLLVTGGVLAMTTGLFFLLPRTANAALRHLAAKGYFIPGFSNQVTLGQIGEVKTRSTPVMHIRVYTRNGRLNAKWRGAALSRFDGNRWFNPIEGSEVVPLRKDRQTILADDQQRRRRGPRVAYRVDLRADTDALFFAGIPEVLNINATGLVRGPAGSYRVTSPADGVRYDAYSFMQDDVPPAEPDSPTVLPAAAETSYTQLPQLDPRIPALAREMSAAEGTDLGRARAIEARLRHDYEYTIELPKTPPADPLAHFLFERRKGHCEYYASAMTVMLRTLRIPARMVTGFQNGLYNPVSGLYVVRASDAHTWVEAFLPGRGWATFDPTPFDPNPPSWSLWSKFLLYADAADTFWQEWVVNYDLGRQLLLADRMEQSTRSFRFDWTTPFNPSSARWVRRAEAWFESHGLFSAMTVAAALWLWWFGPALWRRFLVLYRSRNMRLGQASVSDATLLYARFLHLLERKGYAKPAWYTPTEFVRTLNDPVLAATAENFTAAYQELRFGGKLEAAPRISQLLDELERG